MSIFIIYLKILNCQPLFPTNLLIIVSTVARTFWIFIHFDISHQKHYHHTEHLSLKYFNFALFPWLSAPNRLYYHHSHYFPRLRKSDDLLPPPTLHRSFSFATKSTFRPAPLILYIYLCTKYYAISTLTRTLFAPHTTRSPLYHRRTLWEGKLPGIGRARKMVGVHPRTPARTGKHARTRTQNAPNARQLSTKRPISGHNRPKPRKRPKNAPTTRTPARVCDK